jgi:hypothetical protein
VGVRSAEVAARVVLHLERFVEYLTATYGHDRLPSRRCVPCLTGRCATEAVNRECAEDGYQRSGCCAISARRSASSCSSSARVRRRSSKAMHRSRSVCPLPGSVPPAGRAGAPHRHPQVAGGSIPAASVMVKACPRAHRYAACWREAGGAPGRSAIPVPAPGIDRQCRGMIMNSTGPGQLSLGPALQEAQPRRHVPIPAARHTVKRPPARVALPPPNPGGSLLAPGGHREVRGVRRTAARAAWALGRRA